MPAPPRPRPSAWNLSLSITNPLVLYRALVATKRIKPDPAQHRLALQLQKLYFRLKDYAPEVEYRYRLERIGRRVSRVNSNNRPSSQDGARNPRPTETDGGSGSESGSECTSSSDRPSAGRGIFSSLVTASRSSSASAASLALVRTPSLHQSALTIDSPQGMLLSGEVGRGKSMLLDLLYTSLPSRKKRRWHFNTFMLDIFRRIETARLERLEDAHRRRPRLFGRKGLGLSDHEHVVLTLAKETISDSPILFLDEFQMPDRTSSKLINSFFTAFFHLGGVLVASSNRMPEELSKAAGIEFDGYHHRQGYRYGMGMGGFFGLAWAKGLGRASEGERAAKTDFGLFLDILRARCEVWEMEGDKDWRREEYDDHDHDHDFNNNTDFITGHRDNVDGIGGSASESESDTGSYSENKLRAITTTTTATATPTASTTISTSSSPSPSPSPNTEDARSISAATALTAIGAGATAEKDSGLSSDSPPHYHVKLPQIKEEVSSGLPSASAFESDVRLLNPLETWTPTTLTIYARSLRLETTHDQILKSSFHALCATYLGPADYVSICSTFHTLILTDVPVLNLAQKNEARRFITLLDALYEARCRLVIEAAAPPDKLFFPETATTTTTTVRTKAGSLGVPRSSGGGGDDNDNDNSHGSGQGETFPFATPDHSDSDSDFNSYSDSDSITSESFSEIYQDSTAPFRPNVSSYSDSDSHSDSTLSLWRRDPPNLIKRRDKYVLAADEEADFGPTYGNGRGHGISNSNFLATATAPPPPPPDFTSTSALTGEDERFAYKRARSRLWEMCGRRWWDERLPRRQQQQQPSTTLSNENNHNGSDNDSETVSVDAFDNAAQLELNVHHTNVNINVNADTAGYGSEDKDGILTWWRPVTRDSRFWELKQEQEQAADSHEAKG